MNSRPPRPERGALTKLRYSPVTGSPQGRAVAGEHGIARRHDSHTPYRIDAGPGVGEVYSALALLRGGLSEGPGLTGKDPRGHRFHQHRVGASFSGDEPVGFSI